MRSYSTKKDDEVSVPIGSVVEVLRKSDDGWWLIRYVCLHCKQSFVVFTCKHTTNHCLSRDLQGWFHTDDKGFKYFSELK